MNEKAETFDFMPLGEAIKNAREKNGLTREQLAEQLGITPRHLQFVENEGQHQDSNYLLNLLQCLIFRLTNTYFLTNKLKNLLAAGR